MLRCRVEDVTLGGESRSSSQEAAEFRISFRYMKDYKITLPVLL